jgi:hypothetical protein
MDNGQRQASAAMNQSCGAALGICPHLAGLRTIDNCGCGASAALWPFFMAAIDILPLALKFAFAPFLEQQWT